MAFAVDVSRESIRRASEWDAQVLLVHHGLFWEKPVRLEGTLYERVRALMEGGLALYAAHLPLDAHPEVGNNAGLAKELGLTEVQPFGAHKGVKIGCKGVFASPVALDEVLRKLGSGTAGVRSLPFGPERIRSAGIVTGGAAYDALQAAAEGLDLFITGEGAHGIYHDCLEAGIHAIFAGHYYTETFGVRLLCGRLAADTGLETRYLDVPTGL